MAAAGAPYSHKGTQLTGLDDATIASQLDTLRLSELAKLNNDEVSQKSFAGEPRTSSQGWGICGTTEGERTPVGARTACPNFHV